MKDILQKIINDSRYLKNIEYGLPRPGHPEGAVKYHIAELEEKLDSLAPRISEDYYWKLKFLIHVHDSFKAEAIPDSPITSPYSHASLARAFASEFISDSDILNMLQFHDENFALWKQFVIRGAYDTVRFQALLDTIVDWNLFLLFLILDGSTHGKRTDTVKWFIGDVKKVKDVWVDESWVG